MSGEEECACAWYGVLSTGYLTPPEFFAAAGISPCPLGVSALPGYFALSKPARIADRSGIRPGSINARTRRAQRRKEEEERECQAINNRRGKKRGEQSPQATWDFALSEPAWIADQSRNSTWIDLTQRREGAQGRKEERKRRHQASLGWYLTQKAPGTKIQSGDKLPHSTMQKLAPWRYPTVPDGRSQGPPGVRTQPRRIRPSRGCWGA